MVHVVRHETKNYVWGPPSDDPDINSASLHAKINSIMLAHAYNSNAGYGLPRLIIKPPRPGGLIEVRPDIFPTSLPSGWSGPQRVAGFIFQGESRESTVFRLNPSSTPNSYYYAFNGWNTDGDSDGVFARTHLRDFGVCTASVNPWTGSGLETASLDDSLATEEWKYAVGLFADKWAKEFFVENVLFMNFRYGMRAGTSGSTNGDLSRFENCRFHTIGSMLAINNNQSQVFQFDNCQANDIRRHCFHTESGGGGDIRVRGGFYNSDFDIYDTSEDNPYTPPHFLFKVEGDAATDGKTSHYEFNATMEVRGSYGFVESVPTTGDFSAEARERVFLFEGADFGTMSADEFDTVRGRGRIVCRIGQGQTVDFRNTIFSQREGFNIESGNDYPIFDLVVDDATSSKMSVTRMPHYEFTNCQGSKDWHANHVRYVQDDGTAQNMYGSCKIKGHSYLGETTTYRSYSGSTRIAEDGSWPGNGSRMAECADEFTFSVLSGNAPPPGSAPTVFDRLYLPWCHLVGAEVYVGALAGAQAVNASWYLEPVNSGTAFIASASASAKDAHHAKRDDCGELVTLRTGDRFIDFKCTASGTLSNLSRDAVVTVTYRGAQQMPYGTTVLSQPDPARACPQYSRQFADSLRHFMPCDERADYVKGSTRINDFGLGVQRITCTATGSPSSYDSTGEAIGRWSTGYDGATTYHTATSAGLTDFDFDQDWSLLLWVYHEDGGESNATILRVYKDANNYVKIGSDTSSANEKIVLDLVVGGVNYGSSVAGAVDTWLPVLVTKTSSAVNLFVADEAALAAYTNATMLAMTGNPTQIDFGGTSAANSIMTGKLGGVCLINRYAVSAADWEEARTNYTLPTRQG